MKHYVLERDEICVEQKNSIDNINYSSSCNCGCACLIFGWTQDTNYPD